MSSTAKHLQYFEGGQALSGFRAKALQAQLQAVAPRVVAVHARHGHWVCSETPLSREERDRLLALLSYGDAYRGPADGALIVVGPRLGTVSPWASKATDIAHN